MCPVCVPRRTAKGCKRSVTAGQQTAGQGTLSLIRRALETHRIRLSIRRFWVRVPPRSCKGAGQGPVWSCWADALTNVSRATLVEYGDYECPYCGEAYPILKDIQERPGEMYENQRHLRDDDLRTDAQALGLDLFDKELSEHIHRPGPRGFHERRSERREWDAHLLHRRAAS